MIRARSCWSAPAGAAALALLAPPAVMAQDQRPPVTVSQKRGPVPKYQDIWTARIHETYPREAVVQLIEGSVVIRARVNPEGLVDDCHVVISSRHDILDQAACVAMHRYARFYPALDDGGLPTLGSFTTMIHYRLDQAEPPADASVPPVD